jgi:hypothetical protein
MLDYGWLNHKQKLCPAQVYHSAKKVDDFDSLARHSSLKS